MDRPFRGLVPQWSGHEADRIASQWNPTSVNLLCNVLHTRGCNTFRTAIENRNSGKLRIETTLISWFLCIHLVGFCEPFQACKDSLRALATGKELIKMSGTPNLLRSVSVAALFVLAAASFSRADVTRLDEIAVDATPLSGAYTVVAWPSSTRLGTLSGCIGAYQAPVEAMVFHSVCQGTNLLSESGRDQATMAFRVPISPIFGTGRALESSFGIRVGEMPLQRENWKFDVLEGISAPLGDIGAPSIYSGAGSKPLRFMTGPQSGDESGPLDLGEDMDRPGGNPERKLHHPRKDKDHDGDDLAPEPSTLLLLGTGTFILGAMLRRRVTTVA